MTRGRSPREIDCHYYGQWSHGQLLDNSLHHDHASEERVPRDHHIKEASGSMSNETMVGCL